MTEFTYTVTFTVEAADEQQASNILHTELIRAMFPDVVDWKVTFKAPEAVATAHRAYLSPKVNYDLLNKVVRRQKAALTKARATGDRVKVVETCRAAVKEWNEPGMMWPDDWPRWQNALDEVYPVFHAPTLEELARGTK